MLALDSFAMWIAATSAHEIGHSVGLVQDGAPGAGLYGGMTEYGGANSTHINLRAYYPGLGQNLMQSSSSLDFKVNPGLRFNELAHGYLLNQIIVAAPGE